MTNLIGMIALALLTVVLWFARRSTWAARHPVAFRGAFTAAIAWTLLLALRFGARTYPGLYIRSSDFWNSTLNGEWLFNRGYELVLFAVAMDALSFHFQQRTPASVGVVARIAPILRNVGFALATATALYGFYWANALQRLP